MAEILFGTAAYESLEITYYLLTETDEMGREAYGVQVCCGAEKETIPGITASKPVLQELLTRMIQGIVTPTTARDILNDWLLL